MARSEGKTIERRPAPAKPVVPTKPAEPEAATAKPAAHKSRARTIHADLRHPPKRQQMALEAVPVSPPTKTKASRVQSVPKAAVLKPAPKPTPEPVKGKVAAPVATRSVKIAATKNPEPAPKAKDKVAPQPAPKAAKTTETPVTKLVDLEIDTVDAMEQLSRNLTLAAITAQNALAATLFQPKEPDAATSGDPFQVGPAMTSVVNSLTSHPDKLIEAQNELVQGYLGLWGEVTRKSFGIEGAGLGDENPISDRRFSDPLWEQNIVFDMMKRSYLLSSTWIQKLIESAENVEPLDKRRVEFFTKLMTDAFSPTNFLISNPAALKKLLETNGESLVKGMQRFADDLARGHGKLKITQADTSAFEVGKNIATSPGKVIFRNAYFELLQYTPTTDKVRETPLLIFPPWINKYYILDLQPKNSLIKWLTDQGFSVFVTSWVNPTADRKDTNFEDYLKNGIYEAVAQVRKQCGVAKVNTVGYCIGGTLLGCALAHMKAKGNDAINSATFFTAQHDFSEAGDLMLFTNDAWISELERQMDAAGGVLPGAAMADTFNSLRANDLVWSYFVNNYLLGKDPVAFDLLYWNSDTTRMPKALHMFYLRKFYHDNALSRGELELDGVKIDLKTVTIPIYEQAGREDHIAPPGSVYKGSRMFGGPVTFTMAGSGHIAGVVNPPAANKYQYWTNSALPPKLDDWVKSAEEHPGSWWPHWAAWLNERSGDMIPARDPSKGELKPMGDAPGTYVKVKS